MAGDPVPDQSISTACVRCGNALGPDDFFEDGKTRPHIIHNSDEPDERTEGPLCMRDFRIGTGLGVWIRWPRSTPRNVEEGS